MNVTYEINTGSVYDADTCTNERTCRS